MRARPSCGRSPLGPRRRPRGRVSRGSYGVRSTCSAPYAYAPGRSSGLRETTRSEGAVPATTAAEPLRPSRDPVRPGLPGAPFPPGSPRDRPGSREPPAAGSVRRSEDTGVVKLVHDPRRAAVTDLKASLQQAREPEAFVTTISAACPKSSSQSSSTSSTSSTLDSSASSSRTLSRMSSSCRGASAFSSACIRYQSTRRSVSSLEMYAPWIRIDRPPRAAETACRRCLEGSRLRLVQNRAAVRLRGHAKGDAAGEVGLDQPRDHVHGRPLRRDHQVKARPREPSGQAWPEGPPPPPARS